MNDDKINILDCVVTLILIVIVIFFSLPARHLVSAQAISKQVFAGATTVNQPSGFIGNSSYAITPNPSISCKELE